MQDGESVMELIEKHFYWTADGCLARWEFSGVTDLRPYETHGKPGRASVFINGCWRLITYHINGKYGLIVPTKYDLVEYIGPVHPGRTHKREIVKERTEESRQLAEELKQVTEERDELLAAAMQMIGGRQTIEQLEQMELFLRSAKGIDCEDDRIAALNMVVSIKTILAKRNAANRAESTA